jgi:hypothetical protein
VSQSELKDFLQYLAGDEFRPALIIIAAIAILLIILLSVYLFLRKRSKRTVTADKKPADLAGAPANERPVNASKAPAPEIRVNAPKVPAAGVSRHSIPQDSVLKRHYVTHVKYMIETVTFPRPTDSVLRRHYDHLIASELDACLGDETLMEKLISRYEEYRRHANA